MRGQPGADGLPGLLFIIVRCLTHGITSSNDTRALSEGVSQRNSKRLQGAIMCAIVAEIPLFAITQNLA